MSGTSSNTLADRINRLFETVRPRDSGGRQYSNEHVAAEIGRTNGVQISQSYIWQLRKGKKDNPTLRHLQALADFFGVPITYFFDDSPPATPSPPPAPGSTEVLTRLATRAAALSPERLQQVMDLLDVAYQLEQAERQPRPND